jgi:uncharacterized integral membrane protein
VVTPEQQNQPKVDPAGEARPEPGPESESGAGSVTAPPVTEPTEPVRPTVPTRPAKIKRTRVSGTWIAVIVAVVVLVFLLIFILQNLTSVTVHFLGAAGTLPLGVALLFGAVAGAILVALVGAARILQLRRVAKNAHTRRRGVR